MIGATSHVRSRVRRSREGKKKERERETADDSFFRHGNQNEFDGLVNVRFYRFGTERKFRGTTLPSWLFIRSETCRVSRMATRSSDTPPNDSIENYDEDAFGLH